MMIPGTKKVDVSRGSDFEIGPGRVVDDSTFMGEKLGGQFRGS